VGTRQGTRSVTGDGMVLELTGSIDQSSVPRRVRAMEHMLPCLMCDHVVLTDRSRRWMVVADGRNYNGVSVGGEVYMFLERTRTVFTAADLPATIHSRSLI
jgi:hypothetical protein